MLIFFEQLEIDYVIFNYSSEPTITTWDDSVIPPVIFVLHKDKEDIKKYDNDNKIVRIHPPNHMTNTLFDLLMVHKSATTI